MKCTASATSGAARRAIPAGLDHSVLASSAEAAPPANALPIALPEFSCSANPAPDAETVESEIAMPLIAAATRVRLTASDFILETPLVRFDGIPNAASVSLRRSRR
jgi:hypothetical protein